MTLNVNSVLCRQSYAYCDKTSDAASNATKHLAWHFDYFKHKTSTFVELTWAERCIPSKLLFGYRRLYMSFDHSRSCQVIDFRANRKPIGLYDFLVVNCNLSYLTFLEIYVRYEVQNQPAAHRSLCPSSRDAVRSCCSYKLLMLKVKTLCYFSVKTSLSQPQVFCHNTLASQTDRDRQTTYYTTAVQPARNFGLS